MITATENYSYMGWTYQSYEDYDTDCSKIWHDFVHENGTIVSCDFSPYEMMTPDDIRLWIDLLMPNRIGCGPLDSRDLHLLWCKENIK